MPDYTEVGELFSDEIEGDHLTTEETPTHDDPTPSPKIKHTSPYTFVKLNRGHKIDEFQKKDPNAFLVLALIARRADRSTGEAQMGDFVSCGLSYQEYRTALKHLENKWHMIRRKPINGVGTMVKILSTEIFDINME